jgi:hypothetical protein
MKRNEMSVSRNVEELRTTEGRPYGVRAVKCRNICGQCPLKERFLC